MRKITVPIFKIFQDIKPMSLLNLTIKNFRNITDVALRLNPRCNIFYGENGSGKTSILEAVYFLGLGRSFRSHLFKRVIQYGKPKFILFGETLQETRREDPPGRLCLDAHDNCEGYIIPIGMERATDGTHKIRVAGEDVQTFTELVNLLPLQLITQNEYELFTGGSKQRRRFIDWGVFHVEQSFISLWKKINRILQQRNMALKKASKLEFVKIWDEELVSLSLALNKLREQYISDFLPIMNNALGNLIGKHEIEIGYHAGWNTEKNLADILDDNLNNDRRVGFTQYGAHRADLQFHAGKIPIQYVLSRGQQKLFFVALRLAQGILLRQKTAKSCIYLIDDLASELDTGKKTAIISQLKELNAQIFVTTLCMEDAELFSPTEVSMFHVKHGQVTA